MRSFQIGRCKIFSGWRTSVGSKRRTRVDSMLDRLFSVRDQDFIRKGDECYEGVTIYRQMSKCRRRRIARNPPTSRSDEFPEVGFFGIDLGSCFPISIHFLGFAPQASLARPGPQTCGVKSSLGLEIYRPARYAHINSRRRRRPPGQRPAALPAAGCARCRP